MPVVDLLCSCCASANLDCQDCDRWVAVRIDLVTALVMVSAGTLAVSQAGALPAALLGFSLANSTSLGMTPTVPR